MLNAVRVKAGSDQLVENLRRPFYATVPGRPSLALGAYFRLHLLGLQPGLTSERRLDLQRANSSV